MLFGMTDVTNQTDTNKPAKEIGELFSGGALGFLERTGDAMEKRFDELYSSEKMGQMLDKFMDSLPEEVREGLSQFFNMLSGAGDGPENETSNEYQALGELYGAGGAKNDGVRMAANFAQRDDANFASGVTIGTGMGAITEVNGIQYVNGRAVNDANEDEGVEMLSEAGEQAEREWDRSRVNVGGIEMSGEEWDKALEVLSDEEKRQKVEDELTEEYGGDRKRAKKATTDALELARLAKKRENGTSTAADKQREDEIVRNNPDVGDAAKIASGQLGGFTPKPAQSVDVSLQAQSTGHRSTSIAHGSDLIASQAINADPITPIYNASAQGVAPASEPVSPAADPAKRVELAAATPPPAQGMSSNLDMG
jgi:hypothetical protein